MRGFSKQHIPCHRHDTQDLLHAYIGYIRTVRMEPSKRQCVSGLSRLPLSVALLMPPDPMDHENPERMDETSHHDGHHLPKTGEQLDA